MTGYVLINGEKYSVSIFGGIVHSRPKYRGDLTSRKSNLSERRRSERVSMPTMRRSILRHSQHRSAERSRRVPLRHKRRFALDVSPRWHAAESERDWRAVRVDGSERRGVAWPLRFFAGSMGCPVERLSAGCKSSEGRH